MERIATGYALAEAPVAAEDGGLYFSDVLGGGVHRWSPASGEVEAVVPKRRGIGGMAIDRSGALIVSGRDVSRVDGNESSVLYGDEDATGFNDLTVDPDGRIVVGVLRFRPFAGEQPVPGEFVGLDHGSATEVLAGVEWPNGCAFAPGGTTFYGCDYERGVVLAAEREPDGRYGDAHVAIECPGGDADGMAVDENGGVWVALGGRGTVGRFTPDGELDSEVEVPAGFVSSVCFGGADGRDLFVTTAGDPGDPDAPGGVYMARAPVRGAPIPAARLD